ncbi:hypothetical protein D7V88_03620 [Corallococcus terminator]|uniref:Uncharacterized protein n=1 Tax=Corallococcus terminator TaxID=2316733 RepID=A0A3A8JRT2_9BACT|nr:hypothetical protein D7V88_03620 [Corallococcus terminator]
MPPTGQVDPLDVTVEDPREGTAVISGEEFLPGCGEPDAGSGEADAGTPDTSVLVTADSRFHSSTGVTVVPEDLSGNDLEILIPQGTGYARRTGTPVAGGMRFDNVPDGEYFLRLNRFYYLSRERHFDLGRNRMGRPDAVYSPFSEGTAALSLTQLAPWQEWTTLNDPGSSLQLISGDVDVYAPLSLNEYVSVGATTLNDPSAWIYNSTGRGLPVLDPAKGDHLYLNQLNSVAAGTMPSGAPMSYQTVVNSLQPPSFAFTPDGTTPLPLSGALQPVAQQPFSMEWRLSEFTRWRTDSNPTGTLSYSAMSLSPMPFGDQDGWVGYQGELFTLSLPRGEDGVIASRLAYGNPYPSSWGVVATVSYAFRSATPVVIGSRTHYPSGNVYVTDRLDPLIASPIQPPISPPRQLRIDGVDAYTSRVVGTTQPVFTWQPPVLGTPKAYVLSIIQLIGTFDAAPTLRFYVPGDRTQVRLPPNVLLPGATYYARVAADGSPHYEPWRAPFITAEKLPAVSSDTFSAVFTTP